jgi:hypothetical protein
VTNPSTILEKYPAYEDLYGFRNSTEKVPPKPGIRVSTPSLFRVV